MKEYELYVPLTYNDGAPIAPEKLLAIRERLLRQFGDMTFFSNPAEGYWTAKGITYKDRVVLYRVVASNVRQARRCFRQLKEDLKKELRQEEIFVVEKDDYVL